MFDETFDPLCCLRLFDRPRGGEWHRIVVDGLPDRSLIVGVVPALETPSGYTLTIIELITATPTHNGLTVEGRGLRP